MPTQGTDVLVIGAGVSGATCARQFAEKGYSVTVIDKRDHIGGNCYDYINDAGFRISQYGPHFFHTNSERVWNYVNRFGSWTDYKHKVLARVGDKNVPVPVNYNTIEQPDVSSEQIKSAISNTGAYSSTDPRIQYSKGAATKAVDTALESRGNYLDRFASIGGESVKDRLMQKAADMLNTKKTFNWWHKSVGTQAHKRAIVGDQRCRWSGSCDCQAQMHTQSSLGARHDTDQR